MAGERDDRKTGHIAALGMKAQAGASVITSFAEARAILRSDVMLQGGVGGEVIVDAGQQSIFFLDGEPHRRRRAAVARFFTPKAISDRYRIVMESTTDSLIAQLRGEGRGRLDAMSFQLAVNVAAEIVGLTNSSRIGMAERIRKTLACGIEGSDAGHLTRGVRWIGAVYYAVSFLLLDMLPAVFARRRARQEDVISHLLDEGYSLKALLLECLTYAAGGMLTTREFIVMAGWHLLERNDLRARFLSCDEGDQIAILEEILRLEPVASVLHRKAGADVTIAEREIDVGGVCALDIRAANSDETVAGSCPHMIDPDRAKRMRVPGSYMSFGDGRHRCLGAQVAMQESRVFLDRLLRLPGIRLVGTPTIIWQASIGTYEIRDANISCERSDLAGASQLMRSPAVTCGTSGHSRAYASKPGTRAARH